MEAPIEWQECCDRVQFDRRELGVELVKDVDVMPIDPTESLPSGLLVNAVSFYMLFQTFEVQLF